MDAVHFNGLDAHVAADAMDFMDDVIAGLQAGKDADFLAFSYAVAQAFFLSAEDVPFGDGDDLGIGQFKTVVDFPFDDVHAAGLALFIVIIRNGKVVLFHPGFERGDTLFAVDDKDDGVA